jgi:hypothetical protein
LFGGRFYYNYADLSGSSKGDNNMIMWRMDYDFIKANARMTLPTDDYNSWSSPFIRKFAEQYNCTYDISRHILSCSEEAFLIIKIACPDAVSTVFKAKANY